MTIETPQQRKPLKTVISKAILLPALFVVVLIALAAVIGASILGASSGNAAANALQSQIELHIDASASESAVSIHQQLSHWQRSLTMLAYFGRELFETSPLANQYNGNELFKTPTGAPFFDQGDSLVDAQRFNSSVFYLPETTSGSLSLNAIQKIDATVSQQIDPAFVAVMRDTPSIAALYVGFQSSGVFRRFPPQEVDKTRQYDSRKRGWYTAAVNAGGSPVFTSPYVDAFGLGWMITIAQQIRLPSGGFAVFGADVLLETLVANVRAVSFAETGYGFLYDRRTGETVAHPAFEMEASDDANAVAPQVSVYERDLPEFGAFEKIVDDGETLWTFQDVNNDYRYVVTVSLDEVLKPSQEVGTLAKTLIGVVVAAVVVLGLLAVLATYLAITFYVKAVVNSVQKLGDKAEELTSLIGNGYAGDEKRVQELDEKFVDDNDINRIKEVAECSQAYTDAVKRLKAGQSAQRPNPFYYGARGRPWREGNEKDLKFAAEFSDFDIAVKNNKAVQSKTTLKQFAMKRLLIPVFIIVFLFVAITTAVMAGTYFEVVKEADAATLKETKAQLQRTTRQRSALLGDFFQESLSANRLNRDFIRGVMFDGWYDGGNLNLIRPKLANPEPNARDRTLTSSSNANYGASLWYTPPPITPVAALPALDLQRLDNASLLYIPSRAITDAIDEFFAVYLGAESDGLWISHPYIRYSPPLSEQKFVSAKDGKSVTGYDPRIRTWYVNGSAVFGETEDGILSPPYVDVATNKVIVTAALPYADNLDEFAGVAAIDIDATVLKQATVARAFSANDGYTYVLNEDLAIVIHPIADVGKVQGLQDVEFPASSAETELEERLEFELTLSKLRALDNSGTIDFEKSGETWHAAFENTNAGDLIVLTVISNDGAVAPASAVYDAYVTVIVVFVILVVLLSACLFYSLYRRVEHSLNPAVVGPLNEVNRLLNGEGKPQINDESSKYTSQEIAEVKSLCENSIVAMQFASPESAAAPAERRLGVYADAHKLFDKLQCEYGVGVCKNNEAQATSEMELNKSANKPADNSVQLYLESIEHAKHMLSKETDEQRRRTLQRSLCMRYMGLASVYFHREQYNNAVRTYNEAVTLADQFGFDDVRVTAFLTLADVEQKQCSEQMHVCGNPFGGSKKAVARDKKSKKNKKKEKIDEEKLDAVDPSSARIDAANVEKVKTNFAEWLSVTYPCETSKYYIAAALLTCKFKTHEDLLTLNGRDSDSRTDQKQPLLKFKDSDLELQRAQANVRLFFANHLDSKESPQLIGAALETSPVVDTNTFIGAGQACNSLKTLPGVTSVVQSVVGASSAHRRGGGSGEKLALLMLVDKTGSMAGSKINTARDNVVKIYEEHCLIGDSIAVYHYNTATTKFMSFQTRTVDNEQRLLSQLKANIRAGGMTASYDALIQAFDAFSVDQRLKSKCFIIMLTDGDDGSSRKKVADVKRTISSHDDINLIVLTVHAGHAASSTWAGIVEHAKRSNHGAADVFLHIDVESGQGMDAVDAAFAKAASVMSAARGIEAL